MPHHRLWHLHAAERARVEQPLGTAPGVVRLRTDVELSLREAVLQYGVPDLMSSWTRSAWGADDYQMWLAQRAAVSATSPLLPLITGQIARPDREHGS